jgi:hypothetical protein
MSLSVRTRFEVFKRDRFTCSYCGKHPPEVLLEVDHIHPIAAGGSDELDNLTTACVDCNRGKGGRMLEEGRAPAINRAALVEMQERIEQARAYVQMLGSLQSITSEMVQRVIDTWAEAYKATAEEREDGTFWTFTEYGRWPEERSIRRFLRTLSLDKVLEAVDIAAARIQYPGADAVRYFYGICNNMIRQGRETQPEHASDIEAAYLRGRSEGIELARKALGDILRNYIDNGYESLEAAVLALWPDPD